MVFVFNCVCFLFVLVFDRLYVLGNELVSWFQLLYSQFNFMFDVNDLVVYVVLKIVELV